MIQDPFFLKKKVLYVMHVESVEIVIYQLKNVDMTSFDHWKESGCEDQPRPSSNFFKEVIVSFPEN